MLEHFVRPQHSKIVEALRLMNSEMLCAHQCWFGGGTAIVLKLGEYRQSLDVDFLCSDVEGYRELRLMAVRRGLRAFFPESVVGIRDMRIDQYGIRAAFQYQDQVVKFEIVREGRIALHGAMDAELALPTLTAEDMFTEKMLANADRCQDRSVAYRDAFDLGMLLGRYGEIPEAARIKAEEAYGNDVGSKIGWVTVRLEDPIELRGAAESLDMDLSLAIAAVERVRLEHSRIWGAASGTNS